MGASALDVVGTFAFAVSGGLLAVRKDYDLIGILTLSAAAGCGGGVVRDVLLGASPPVFLRGPGPMLVVVAAAAAALAASRFLVRSMPAIVVLDALGLGFFSVVGTTRALDAGLGAPACVIIGTITAVGGGVIRDVLAVERPKVFCEDVYATAAAVGATLVVAGRGLGWGWPVEVIAVAVVIAVRLVTLSLGLGVPRGRPLPEACDATRTARAPRLMGRRRRGDRRARRSAVPQVSSEGRVR